MKPDFSIIMANYNKSNYIAQSIQSVINQSYKNWELLIGDDCSKDNSISIIEPFLVDSRIKLIKNKENLGSTNTQKKLISLTSANIIGILDSDDALLPEAIEIMLNEYKEHPDTGFVYSQYMVCDEKLVPQEKGWCKKIPSQKSNLHTNYTSHFKTFKKNIYLKTDGLDDKILYADDMDLVLKMEEVTKMQFVDKALYLYRVLPDSLCHEETKSKIGMISYNNAKYNAYVRRLGTSLPNISRKEMSYLLFYSSAISLKIKKNKQALSLLIKAIKLSPFNLSGYKIFFLISIKYFIFQIIKKTQKILNHIKYKFKKKYNISYSQNGEDIMIFRIFKNLNISNIYYLDIGANHPIIYNNTYLLYKKGSSGVCVEPNTELTKKIKSTRPRDIVLNIAVSNKNELLEYYAFKSHMQNTFSKEEAEKNIKQGNKLINKYKIEAKTLESILKDLPKNPDLISLDVEGFDEKVIENFNFKNWKPKVWCIETIERVDNIWKKNKSIIKLMEENGYVVYGDTNINTIFVEKEMMNKINNIK